MEEKLDGERMQLHMRGKGAQWFYCSRKAKDYSELRLLGTIRPADTAQPIFTELILGKVVSRNSLLMHSTKMYGSE